MNIHADKSSPCVHGDTVFQNERKRINLEENHFCSGECSISSTKLFKNVPLCVFYIYMHSYFLFVANSKEPLNDFF